MNKLNVHIFLFVTLGALCFASIALGSVYLSLGDIWKGESVLVFLRASKTITAIFAGAGISLAGLLLQTLFRNPLAGPSVLGVSSGASLGIAIGIALFPMLGLVETKASTLLFGIGGALLVIGIVLVAARYIKTSNTLLIIGLMLGYFVSSMVSILSFYTDKSSLQQLVFWGLGSFEKELNIYLLSLYVFLITLSFILSFVLVKSLDVLLLGDQYAIGLGLNVRKIRIVILLLTGVLVGVITVWCGPIAFLGIAVPHLARNVFQTSKHFPVIIGTFWIGASLALACDVIARMPGMQEVLPLNAVTSIVGAPIVVWIIFKHKMI